MITREGIYLTGIALVLLLMAANTGYNLLYLIFATLVAVLLLSITLVYAVPLRGELQLSAPESVQRSEPFTLAVQFRRRTFWGRFVRSRVRVTLWVGREEPLREEVVLLQQVEFDPDPQGVRLTAQLGPRGVYSGGRALIESSFPFGLWRRRYTAPVELELAVTPRLVEPGDAPPVEMSGFGGLEEVTRPQRAPSGLFHGVREVVGNVPVRHVHWRLSAKLGQLVLIEREQEPVNRLALLVAPPWFAWASGSSQATEEYERWLDAAASVLDEALLSRQALSVGASQPQFSWTPFGAGEHFRQQILRKLAGLPSPSAEQAGQDWLARAIGQLPPFTPLVIAAPQGSRHLPELMELIGAFSVPIGIYPVALDDTPHLHEPARSSRRLRGSTDLRPSEALSG